MNAVFVNRAIFGVSAMLLLGVAVFTLVERRLERRAKAERVAQDEAMSALRSENRQLKIAAQAAQPTAPALVAAPLAETQAVDPLERTKAVVELFRSGLMGEMSWPHPPRNSLENGFAMVADVLGLTTNEAAVLQQAVEAGRQQFAAALVTHAKVERDGPRVDIELSDHPSIRAAYDQMEMSIASVLGSARYGYYQALGAKAAIENLFNNWGLKPARVTVERRPDARYPEGLYHFSRYRAAPGGGGGGGGGGRTPDRASLGINLGPLESLIPADL